MARESRIFTDEAELEWRGGRPALDVQPPPEFPAGDETSWSPEHAGAARDLTPKAERDCFISASTTAEVSTDWRIIE
jgi:hypothetical protein